MSLALVVLGAVCLLMAGLSAARLLPRNHLFGIRTRSTLSSTQAWKDSHAAVAGEVGAAAVLCFVLAPLSLVLGRDAGLAFLVVVLGVLVHCLVRAERVAKEVAG